jgi:hypothetical protein
MIASEPVKIFMHMSYAFAMMGGIALSAVTVWLVCRCFSAELGDDVRKLLKDREESPDAASKPPLYDKSIVVRKKDREAIVSGIKMDEAIRAHVERALAAGWFRRTFVDRARTLIMPYYDNRTGEVRAGGLI